MTQRISPQSLRSSDIRFTYAVISSLVLGIITWALVMPWVMTP